MTLLPICETQQGDVTGYIASNLISMTDGQLYLSSELFYEGIKPAIDVGLSVSRIGNKVQPHLLRRVSGSLRLDLLQHQELMRLTRFAVGSEETAQRQRRGILLRRLMSQPAHQPMSVSDEALLFYAFQTGWLERLNDEGLQICLRGLSERMPVTVLEALRDNQPISPALLAKLDAVFEDALQAYVTTSTGVPPHAI